MKRSSLQWKLTLWFSAALVLMAVLTFIVVFFVSHSVLQKQLRTELIHTVEDNVDEVEFYRSIAQMDQDGDTDHYIRYGVGYLEIDDDFLNDCIKTNNDVFDLFPVISVRFDNLPVARHNVPKICIKKRKLVLF